MPVEKAVYSIAAGEYRKLVAVSPSDYEMLTIYSGMKHCSRRQCMHEMIGTAAKCWEEHHPEELKRLRRELKDCRASPAGEKALAGGGLRLSV